MSKANYITLIDTKLPDGTSLPSSQHRETMHTDPNSIIEVVYGDSIEETKATESILTTDSVDLTFSASIIKVGRQVTITGRFRNESSSSIAPRINITDSDYKSKEDVMFYGLGMISNESIIAIVENMTTPIALSRIRFSTILLPNEAIDFTVTYASNL